MDLKPGIVTPQNKLVTTMSPGWPDLDQWAPCTWPVGRKKEPNRDNLGSDRRPTRIVLLVGVPRWHVILAQVMTSWFLSSSPISGSVLTAWSLPWILCPPLSDPPALTFSLSKIIKILKNHLLVLFRQEYVHFQLDTCYFYFIKMSSHKRHKTPFYTKQNPSKKGSEICL